MNRKGSLSKFPSPPKSISDQNKMGPEATISTETSQGSQEVRVWAQPESGGLAEPPQCLPPLNSAHPVPWPLHWALSPYNAPPLEDST